MRDDQKVWTEKPEECDGCGFETGDLTEYDAYARNSNHGPGTPENEKSRAWLCAVCQSTPCGSAYRYPRSYENAEVLRQVAYGTNMILLQIIKRT